MTVARSRGVSERALTWRYAMRNSAIPVFTALGTRFAAMLNGVVVVEVVFAWPGVGSLVVRALETRDYPLIQATVLVTAVLAVVVQLLVDLCYPLLDPGSASERAAANDHRTDQDHPLIDAPAEPRPAPSPEADLARAGATPARPRQPRQDLGRHDLRPAGGASRGAGPGPAAAGPERHRTSPPDGCRR